MTFIKKFDEISKTDVLEVGGKGASLGELTKAGFPVPQGFVITANAFQRNIDEKEILKAFDELNAQRVAVRSSAIAEDSSQASWAGQLETYLNTSREDLIENIKKCWNSIKSERALNYAAGQDLTADQLTVAVVIQKMIESKVSGVMFSVNPISKNTNQIMIEGGYGLGEMLVQGLITPDNFIVDKKNLEIMERNIDIQETMLIFKDGKNTEVPVRDDLKDKQVVSDEIIKQLAGLAIKIENHYGIPQDIEWAIDRENKIWILQSRPITTL